MARRIEWRNVTAESDALVAIEEGSNVVVRAWQADADLLADFLNDMDGLDPDDGGGTQGQEFDPAEWGELVMARSDDGDILYVDPERFWDGIAIVFRSRGHDPHPWRGRF